MQSLVLARLPNRLDAKHPRIIEDLLTIANDGHIEALKAISDHARQVRFMVKN